MQWALVWLEALGLLAVTFAIGIAAGFWLSRLSVQSRPGRRPASRPARAPAKAPAQAGPEPAAAETRAPDTSIPESPVPESQVVAAPPKSGPQAWGPQPWGQPAFAVRMRYPSNSFGVVSETRPDPGQPSS